MAMSVLQVKFVFKKEMGRWVLGGNQKSLPLLSRINGRYIQNGKLRPCTQTKDQVRDAISLEKSENFPVFFRDCPMRGSSDNQW